MGACIMDGGRVPKVAGWNRKNDGACHKFGGDAISATCSNCGMVRVKYRKRRRGDNGSTWKRSYDGVEGPAPPCTPF
jgi:hypothetical protein